MFRITIAIVFVLFLAIASGLADESSDELEGSVSVISNRVIVTAKRRTPAAGTPVRLMRGDRVVDEGRIDDNGYWLGVADQVGDYEIWLGSPANEAEMIKMPVRIAVVRSENDVDAAWLPPCCRVPMSRAAIVKAAAAQERLPYFTGIVGLGFLLAGGIAYLRFHRASSRTTVEEASR
jgi:hypothetical protein